MLCGTPSRVLLSDTHSITCRERASLWGETDRHTGRPHHISHTHMRHTHLAVTHTRKSDVTFVCSRRNRCEVAKHQLRQYTRTQQNPIKTARSNPDILPPCTNKCRMLHSPEVERATQKHPASHMLFRSMVFTHLRWSRPSTRKARALVRATSCARLSCSLQHKQHSTARHGVGWQSNAQHGTSQRGAGPAHIIMTCSPAPSNLLLNLHTPCQHRFDWKPLGNTAHTLDKFCCLISATGDTFALRASAQPPACMPGGGQVITNISKYTYGYTQQKVCLLGVSCQQ